MSRPATTLCTLATSGLMSLVFAQPVMAQTISAKFPPDIAGGAPNASQKAAAAFAWQEFIALNWPAVQQTGKLNTRGFPDGSRKFGQQGVDGNLVWETLRSKVEIYPGAGSATVTPNGYIDNRFHDFGFDGLPQYQYDGTRVGTYPYLLRGQIPADIGQPKVTMPSFINLDEDNEIEEDAMFAGIAPANPLPGQQFLYVAKASRKEYTYVAKNKWWYRFGNPTITDARNRTTEYVSSNKKTPPPAESATYISFPYGTFEVKSAWRRLTAKETQNGRFHTSRVRYYVPQILGKSYGGTPGNGNPNHPAWREEVWGMCALHIIHKTPSAPYFIYATFEQADNILNTDGTESVETVSGEVKPAYTGLSPLDPQIKSTPAPPKGVQILQALGPFPDPQKRLYYKNLPTGEKGHPVPRGPIAVQRRIHSIPAAIISANKAFQAAIIRYDQQNGVTGSPWRYYKLVNVQWKPLTKEIPGNPFGKGHGKPGTPYVGPNVESYYLSNIVVETDYNLQVFSGILLIPDATNGLITDFDLAGATYGQPAYNVPFAGLNYNMGGCMGCHGNAAKGGNDFSFIFKKSSVSSPEFKLEYKSLTPP